VERRHVVRDSGPVHLAFLCFMVQAAAASAQMTEPLPLFELITKNGVAAKAIPALIDSDWSVKFASAKALRAVPGNEIVSLRRVGGRLPAWPEDPQVVLVNGDRLVGRVRELTDDKLRIECALEERGTMPARQVLTLPSEDLALLWWAAPDGIEDAEWFQRKLLGQERKQDIVWLRNGDRLEGDLTDLANGQARVRTSAGAQAAAIDRIAVIALATEFARRQSLPGLHARLVLADGSRLALISGRADGHTLQCITRQGMTLRIGVDRIRSIDVLGGCAVYLSELRPSSYKTKSYLGITWSVGQNVGANGHGMMLQGGWYDLGIGLHSESRLEYDLKGAYDWFEALVGLDERAGRKGSAHIEVLVDGKPQDIGRPEMSGIEAPRPIRVRVVGRTKLALIVKFGRGGDVQDQVDWAEARLIKLAP
jgi:hypothetical protein